MHFPQVLFWLRMWGTKSQCPGDIVRLNNSLCTFDYCPMLHVNQASLLCVYLIWAIIVFWDYIAVILTLSFDLNVKTRSPNPFPLELQKKTQEKRVEDSPNVRCFTQDRLTRQGLSCLVIQLPRQDPAGAGSGAGRGGQMKCRARQSSAHTTQSSCGAGRGCAPHARPGRHQLERRCGAGAAPCCAAAVVTSRGGRRRLWS